jgi:superkiller protein 3
MFGKRSTAASAMAAGLVVSLLAPFVNLFSQDLVATEDIGGGSSVFVFRESAKKPQVKAAGGSGVLARAGRGGGRRHIDSAYLATKRKHSTVANSGPATRRPAPAATKIRLAETLAAKAETQMQAGQTDTAIATYREALKNNPKNARATEGLSDALTAKGIDAAGDTNADAGARFLEEAVKLDPKNSIAFAKLGEIYTTGGQTERGIQNYETALAIDPTLTDLYVPLGLAYIKTGNIAKAEYYAGKADAAGAGSADAMFLRGVVAYKQNQNPEALAAFQKTLAADPNYSSASYYEAATYDRLNQGNQSIATYKKTVELDPEFAPAWFDLGVAYYNAADYKDAAPAYEQAVKYDPKNALTHANLASTYRQLERFADANAQYAQADALGMNKNADMYNEWGYCLGKTDEWDKSTLRLIAARDLGHEAADDSNVGWAYYNAGNEAKAKNDDAAAKDNYDKGRVALEQSVKEDPKLDAGYMNLGSTYNALGEFQLAVNVLNTALGLHRDWVIAMNQLGVGYRGSGDLNAAIAQFQRATTLDGNNVFGLFRLGEAYNASGNKKEAKKVQDRLKRIDPNVAAQLENVLAGKAVIDAARQIKKIKIPGIPY